MKPITNYRELTPNNYYYINAPGLIVKENEQGPQPRYNSKECLLFIEYTHEHDHVAKFEKKNRQKCTPHCITQFTSV